MRNPSPASGSLSWRSHKNAGKQAYDRGDYEDALSHYRAAVNPEYINIPRQEKQIILSNIVACRLKIGGTAQARAAVEDAKQCVSLNTNWAKGHLRLASAYIALGGHSNDACIELQTTLRLDPGNSLARQMLVRELRRDHSNYSASSHAAESEEFNDPPENPDYVATESGAADPVDDSISWTDRLKFYAERTTDWYSGQSEGFKTFIKIVMVLLVLYVAFGGRFGLEGIFGSTNDTHGNYERGNAYDQYYRRTSYSNDYDYDYSSRYSRGRGYSSTSSFQFPSLFDGSLPSFAILIAVAYICHLNGINPFQAILVLNMMGRRGRGGRVMYGGGYGGGGMRWGRRRRW